MRLGQKLLNEGLVKESDIAIALKEQEYIKKPLGKLLVDMGFVNEKEMLPVLAKHLNRNFVNLDIFTEPLPLTSKLEMDRLCFYPYQAKNGTVEVAIDDLSDIERIEKIYDIVGHKNINFSLCDKKTIQEKLRIEGNCFTSKVSQYLIENNSTVLEEWNIVHLLNLILEEAIDLGVSDIHFEPRAFFFNVRFRIDGVLHRFYAFHKKIWMPFLTRIKVVSELDISENRLSQDGQFNHMYQKESVDIRVSCQPTITGEKIVLRVLKKKSIERSLLSLGFEKNDIEKLEKNYHQPNGLILFTGPTGSGKTTSLFSIVNEIKEKPINIVTIEDPVEYEISNVTQCSIEKGSKMGFESYLKSILRQDPDVILLGEIRDKDVAQAALDASVTGHLVFSSLHSDSAMGALIRLINLDVDKGLICSGLKLIVNQRLVRKLCVTCSGEKCEQCNQIGYKGRTVVAEIMEINNELIKKISKMENSSHIATENSYSKLKLDAHLKVRKGITDKEECERVIGNFNVGV